jgi:hypothetical protein
MKKERNKNILNERGKGKVKANFGGKSWKSGKVNNKNF